MGRKTFSFPVFIVGTTGTDGVLEVSKTQGDDSNIGTRTIVLEASGDLKTQNVGGQKVALGPFIKQNMTTNMSAVVVDIAGLASVHDEITMPYAGSIIGLTGCIDAAITAGTATLFATKNGTTVFQTSNAATGVQVIRNTQNKDVDTFAAGDRIGVKLTTSTDLNANLDMTAFVFVEI